jgi:protein-disulfide isomerase
VRGTPSTIILHLPTWRYTKVSGAQSATVFTPNIEAMQAGDWSHFHVATTSNPGAWGAASVDEQAYEAFLETAVIVWNPDAPVTVIEFSDIECPFCQRHVSNWTIDAVQEKYGDQVNTIFAHFPLTFHANAQDAAEAVECAGEQWWDAWYLAFKKAYFDLWGNADLEQAKIAASSVWLDSEVLIECVESNIFEQHVKDQMSFGKSLWVTGTPWNIVIDNDSLTALKISGAVPVSIFDEAIERFLEE